MANMMKCAELISKWTQSIITQGSIDPATTKGHAANALVSLTIGYRLNIPSEAVNDPLEWYNTHAKDMAMMLVSQLNEVAPTDFDECCLLTYRIWLERYNLVHNAKASQAMAMALSILKENKSDFSHIYEQIFKLNPSYMSDNICYLNNELDRQFADDRGE